MRRIPLKQILVVRAGAPWCRGAVEALEGGGQKMPNSRCSIIGLFLNPPNKNQRLYYLFMALIYLHYFYGRVTRDGALGV